MPKLLTHQKLKINSKSSRKTIDGVEHLVVPCIAIKEGVLNSIYYSADQINTFSQAWNGVPVPVYHPKKGNNYVSANNVDIEETQNIGRVYNVNFIKKKKQLKCELWLNIEKADSLGFSEVITSLESGEIMEVSTGMFQDTTPDSGEYNSKPYTHTAHGIRPDHIALLPDEVGACSVADGCGVRANQLVTNCEGCGGTCGGAKERISPNQSFWERMKTKFFGNAETSHSQVRSAISSKLSSELGSDPWPYVMDVYSNYFIYELGQDLFKQSYSIDANDNSAIFIGDAQEVKAETEYKPVTNQIMKPKKEMIDALITNTASGFTEENRTALEGMPDKALEQLSAANEVKPEPVKTPEPTANASALSDSDRQLLETFKANHEKSMTKLRESAKKANPHLSDGIIANMDQDALEELSAAPSGGTANYSPAGGSQSPTANSSDDKPYVHVDVMAEAFKKD